MGTAHGSSQAAPGRRHNGRTTMFLEPEPQHASVSRLGPSFSAPCCHGLSRPSIPIPFYSTPPDYQIPVSVSLVFAPSTLVAQLSIFVSVSLRQRTPFLVVRLPRSSGGLACVVASSMVTATSCAAASSRSDFQFLLSSFKFLLVRRPLSVVTSPRLSLARLRSFLPRIPNPVVRTRPAATRSPLSLRYSLFAIRCLSRRYRLPGCALSL